MADEAYDDGHKVGVLGARGRMGRAIVEAMQLDPDIDLVASLAREDRLEDLADAQADVVVEVTNAESARHNLLWCAANGIDAVVGTTGFTDDDVKRFDDAFRKADRRCFLVPNFSIGAVLLMRFAAEAAPYFDGVEIIELHHERKKDAPSGTAALTASMIAESRGEDPWVPDPTEHETARGVRGGTVDGVHVHSVRLPGLLAHQEVLLGSAGQILTLRHDSYDRAAFMPGVLRAVKLRNLLQPGVTTGLDAVL